MTVRVEIAGIAAYLPPDIWTSADVEARLHRQSPCAPFNPGTIERVTGVRARRFAADGVYCSDLAVEAARRALQQTSLHPRDVDLLIFAAASQDLIEPATANIVQDKLGTNCPIFDLKNACNSFLGAVEVAGSLISSDTYRTVLVATGETPSRGINWEPRGRQELKRSFMAYTFGDAGAAAVLRPASSDSGILYQSFESISRHWDLATIPGGGSMHPRGDAFATFQGDGRRLKQAFLKAGNRILTEALRATETSITDYQRILVHQVALQAYEGFIKETRVPPNRVELTVRDLGNMAAASLPVAFVQAQARGAIQPGDLVMWVGLAAGISLSVMITRA